MAAALVEVAEALQDPLLSSGSQLLRPPSPGKAKQLIPESKTMLAELKKKIEVRASMICYMIHL